MTLRVNIEGKTKRQELLDAALDFFYKNDYEKTSINDIIKKVGVSKGAFYHYFKSKEKILEAIAESEAQKMLDIIKEVVDNKKLNGLEKFNELIRKIQEHERSQVLRYVKIYSVMKDLTRVRLVQDIADKFSKKVSPIMKSVLKQGVKEGHFKTEYAEELGDVYFNIGTALSKPLLKCFFKPKNKPSEKLKYLERQFNFYQNFIERVLGASPGVIKIMPRKTKCSAEFLKLIKK